MSQGGGDETQVRVDGGNDPQVFVDGGDDRQVLVDSGDDTQAREGGGDDAPTSPRLILRPGGGDPPMDVPTGHDNSHADEFVHWADGDPFCRIKLKLTKIA